METKLHLCACPCSPLQPAGYRSLTSTPPPPPPPLTLLPVPALPAFPLNLLHFPESSLLHTRCLQCDMTPSHSACPTVQLALQVPRWSRLPGSLPGPGWGGVPAVGARWPPPPTPNLEPSHFSVSATGPGCAEPKTTPT